MTFASFFRITSKFVSNATSLGLKFLRSALSFIASGTICSHCNDASDNAAGGGIFNFRTEKFDDGTDPAGWYKEI